MTTSVTLNGQDDLKRVAHARSSKSSGSAGDLVEQ